MGRYRKIDPRIWGDEKFKEYSKEEKISWIYLLTNDACNSIGLYRLFLEKMGREIGIGTISVRRLIAFFTSTKRIFFDENTNLIWIPRFLEYNKPEGLNQAKGYLAVSDEFLPHKFALAFQILFLPLMQEFNLTKSILNKKQAIIIRDECKCAYCKKEIESWDEIEIDHVIPDSKKGENGKYEDLVCSCKKCNHQKGSRSADDFGFPFVSGYPFSLALALEKLINNPDMRNRFSKILHGLPTELKNISIIDELFHDTPPFERHSNGIRTEDEPLRTPFELRSSEQEQRAGTGTGERGAAPPEPQKGKLRFGEFQNILLSEEERQKLIKKHGEEWVSRKIESFSNSLKSQPKKYSRYLDHYATLNNWISADKEKGHGQQGGNTYGADRRSPEKIAEAELLRKKYEGIGVEVDAG